ncbi:MAG: 2-succinyl-5-enolpyruvyl-6-hydroxy-3-cyclohexene-1-carboxylic-acid synthase [Candidatus Hydrogenedentes bacterium]|nr:2-succinyl-5-enolpyruvyl-6-hydroxy-3-cyclohexene-1-carboxylic-acid synthase [Candidatus Hydrogenedentota bacterium]
MSAIAAKTMNELWAKLIVEELVRCGVDRFVLSPGSRCTPLTLAVAEHPRAKSVVHFDERGAAFFALGQARALGRPVALICTSGTATANYLPAIVEAAQSMVPLIVLTADRPPELLDTGANQTIDQNHLYGRYARWHHAVPCPDRAIAPEVVLTSVDHAVYRALSTPQGPVHLNCAYREPLAPVESGEDFESYLSGIATWRSQGRPYTTCARTEHAITPEDARFLTELLRSAQRGVIVAGQMDAQVADEVLTLGQALGWPILADVTSSLGIGTSGTTVIHHYDLMLHAPQIRESLVPDVVLHFGGAVTSKRLMQQLESRPPEHYICVANHPLRRDPIHRVTLRVQTDPGTFCVGLASACRNTGALEWTQMLLAWNDAASTAIDAHLNPALAISEPGLARQISRLVDEGNALFLGNSMPIRDMDVFGDPAGERVAVYANRGASGIDGNIATAAGIALARGCTVTAVIGDLAALHDLNSLALLGNREAKVILIIINNDGGGIFHFLPVAERTEQFEQYVGTPHGLAFASAAEQFGLKYARPSGMDSFTAAYEAARELPESSIIEVQTERESNRALHRELQEAVVAAIESHPKA